MLNVFNRSVVCMLYVQDDSPSNMYFNSLAVIALTVLKQKEMPLRLRTGTNFSMKFYVFIPHLFFMSAYFGVKLIETNLPEGLSTHSPLWFFLLFIFSFDYYRLQKHSAH